MDTPDWTTPFDTPDWTTAQPLRPPLPLMTHPANEARRVLCMFAYPTVVLVGVVSNLLALRVLTTAPSLRGNPTSLSFGALAILDSLYLSINGTRYFIRYAFGFDYLALHIVSCKILNFSEFFIDDISVWTLVFLTFQRFASIYWPLRAAAISTKRRTIAALSLITLLSVAKSAAILKEAVIEYNGLLRIFFCSAAFNANFWGPYSWVDLVTRCLFPGTTILLLNIGIIARTRRAGARRRTMTSEASETSNQNAGNDDADNMRIQRMLLSVSFVFIICYTPHTIFSLLQGVLGFVTAAIVRGDFASYAIYSLIFQIGYLMTLISHAINFFLYLASGRKFRQAFVQSLSCSKQRKSGAYSTSRTQMTSASNEQSVSKKSHSKRF